MSDKLNVIIQDIAMKHGVVLGKDDPILILHTMNDNLLEENRKAHEDLLVRFKEEMEHISSQWKNDTKEKAEKILNATLVSSKEAMTKLLQESTRDTVGFMKQMISDSLTKAQNTIQQAQKYCRFALLSAVAILITSSLLLFEVLLPMLKIR